MRITVPTSDAALDPVRVGGTTPFEEWTITGVEGDVVPVRVARPDGDPRAIILAAHGLTGHRAVPYIAGASRQWLRAGVAVISLDFPAHGDRRAPGGGFEDAQEPGTIAQALGDLGRVLDLTRAELGPSPIVALGFSMGAQFATLFAAQDDRVAALCLVVAGSNARRIKYTNPRLPPDAWEFLDAVDPAAYAPEVSPRPVLMLCADRDEQFDRIAAFDLYDAFTAPKELMFFPGTHTEWPHPGPVYRRISAFVEEAAEGRSLRP